MQKFLFFLFMYLIPTLSFGKPFVGARLMGQLGNQMFQIAAAVALAEENDADVMFPSLLLVEKSEIPTNREKIFFRVPTEKYPRHLKYVYRYPSLKYKPIKFKKDMAIVGFFQSESYFKKYKKKILDLFEPSEEISSYLHNHYSDIINHPKTVAVHVRCYWPHHPTGKPDGKGALPFLGFDWFERAMKQFPDDSLFVVFSDNIPFCKEHLEGTQENILFIENEPYYHDIFLMSMCKHNIISNSSFSWWGAYMNKNPKKKVIAPDVWFLNSFTTKTKGLIPNEWKILK